MWLAWLVAEGNDSAVLAPADKNSLISNRYFQTYTHTHAHTCIYSLIHTTYAHYIVHLLIVELMRGRCKGDGMLAVIVVVERKSSCVTTSHCHVRLGWRS